MSPAPLSPIPPTISPSNPQSTTPPTPSLNSLVATDLAASNELAERITQLRLDIANGKPLPPKKVDLTERSNRDMVKDLVSRVEKIETSAELDATDRETLQALNARLAVCDLQAMRLAELRDLEVGARMGRKVIGLRAEGVEEEEEEEDGLSDGDGDDFERVGEHDSNSACDSHSEDDDNNTTSSTYSSDLSPNTTTWPLLYRILDVDPGVSGSDIKPMLTRSYKSLALKHSPQYLPNDPSAPARWEKITKAYEILIDGEKRMYYDAHKNTPPELEGFDLAVL